MVLDPRKLSSKILAKSNDVFDEFTGRTFLPANEAYKDFARQDLDRTVFVELLGLPDNILNPLDRLRWQWCNEPTVHGGKHTKPSMY